MDERVRRLEKVLAHEFKECDLAIEAITSSSARGEHGHRDIKANKSLAYVGDAVLDLVVRHHQRDFGDPPGIMTAGKQNVVNQEALGRLAIQLGFADILVRSKGHQAPNPGEKVWEEALEAAIGAVFLDAGYTAAAASVRKCLGLQSRD